MSRFHEQSSNRFSTRGVSSFWSLSMACTASLLSLYLPYDVCQLYAHSGNRPLIFLHSSAGFASGSSSGVITPSKRIVG